MPPVALLQICGCPSTLGFIAVPAISLSLSLSLSLSRFNREHLRVILLLNYELCLLLLLNCVLYNCIADLLYFSNLNKVDFYLWVCRFSIKEKVNLVAVISLPCSVVLLSNGWINHLCVVQSKYYIRLSKKVNII